MSYRRITLAALLVACNASGEIVHKNLPATEPVVFPQDANGTRLITGSLSQQTFAMDLDNNGTADINFYYGPDFAVQGVNGGAVWSQLPGQNDINGFAIPLTAGTVLGASGNPGWFTGPSALQSARDTGSIGYFTGLEQGYLGVQFLIEGQTHYGWISAGSPLVGFNGGWVYDYAWETQPGVPITIGAVPEPGTVALLATGAAALYWRRRKNLRGP